MKKQFFGAFLLGLTAVSVLGTTTAFADDTTTADVADMSQKSATTNGNISFGAGTLSLFNVTDTASFNKDEEAMKISNVYLNGYSADAPLTATVADFLGEANDKWSLKLTQTGWVDASDKTTPNTALNSGTLSVTTPQGTPLTLTKDAGVEYATGTAGQTVLPGKISLSLHEGTTVQKGSYSNTLNWNLSTPVSDTVD